MIAYLLPLVQPNLQFSLGLILFPLYIVSLVIGIIFLYKAIVFFNENPKELKLTRIELAKLADEVHQIRAELKQEN